METALPVFPSTSSNTPESRTGPFTLSNREMCIRDRVNGVVDYAEAALGRGYAYYVAWFMTLIYYPTITSTLGWVTSQYAAILFGFPVAGMTHYCCLLYTSRCV